MKVWMSVIPKGIFRVIAIQRGASRRLSILPPRREVVSHVIMHLALVGIPTPRSIVMQGDVLKGIELKAPKFGPAFVIPAMLYVAMP